MKIDFLINLQKKKKGNHHKRLRPSDEGHRLHRRLFNNNNNNENQYVHLHQYRHVLNSKCRRLVVRRQRER
jgi:hypothetical protein